MTKFIKGAILSIALLGSIPVAEAMPAISNLTAPATTAGVPQIEKTVVIVRRRVIVRRPRVIVRRPFIRRRPGPLVRALRHL